MDQRTQSYRLDQIAKLKNADFNYQPSIKIIGGCEGSTNFMAISKEEFISICQLLTENKIDTDNQKF